MFESPGLTLFFLGGWGDERWHFGCRYPHKGKWRSTQTIRRGLHTRVAKCVEIYGGIFQRFLLTVTEVYIHEKVQQDAHFSYWIFALRLSAKCFEQVIVYHQEEVCTSSIQYFTLHLKMSLVTDNSQTSSWWWTIICSKHVEDKSNETPTWCSTVQVLFLQSHSTCFGRKRPSSGVFKTSTAATGTCVL